MTLLRAIEIHLRDFGVAPTSFGRAALGDPRLVRDLRAGRSPRPKTEARLRAYLREREGTR